MQLKDTFKSFVPHLWVIGIFVVLSCAFCYPAFQGNTIMQHDINTWLEGSKESRDYYTNTGESALWANNMFSGMPQNLIDFYSTGNWYNKLAQMFQFYTHGQVPNPATFFFIAMVCFYILTCALKINRWIGAIAAIAFAFSAYNAQIVSAGHTTKMLDIAYAPAIFAGVILAYRGKYLLGAAVAGIFLSFAFDAGHWQIVYYTALCIAVMVIAQFVVAIKKGTLKRFFIASALLLTVAVLAVATNATRLMLLQEYSPHSTRGGKSELTTGTKDKSTGLDKDYAFSWSVGVSETLCILIPNLYGGSTQENIGEESNLGKKLSSMGVPPQQVEGITQNAPLYWGAQQEMMNLAGPTYFGAVICLLFVLALLVIKSKHKWWVAGLSALFLIFAMGKNFSAFNYLMFDYFPGYNKFRSPNMAASITSVFFPLLAAWALRDIFAEKISKEELWKKLRIAVMITGGICLLALIATQTAFDYKGAADDQILQRSFQNIPDLMTALRQDRADVAGADALRSLIFVLLAAVVLWAFAKSKIKKEMAIAALGLLIAFDLIPVAHRYLNEKNFVDDETYALQSEPSPADRQILQDKDQYYRVLDWSTSAFNDSKPSLFHKSVGGYSGAKLQIYQELIENQLGKLNVSVLNMLNTKYIIVGGQNNQKMVQPNPTALGNAWFVSEAKWVKTADEEMKALDAPLLTQPGDSLAGNFNPAQTAILRETYKSDLGNYAFGKDAAAYVKLTPGGYGPRRLKYESNNSQAGLAVFSDIYYPLGWKAMVDGKETPIMRTDYVLRAIKVPAGKHTIEFTYDSPAYEKGERYALIGSILLTLVVLGAIYVSLFAKRKEEDLTLVEQPFSERKK